MQAHQLVNQNSGNYELYTPPEITAAVRAMFGVIDLDPASSEIANKAVQAKQYFTEEDDGLSKEWFGNVWLNHPFGKYEKACSKNCKKKICERRGYHLLKDFPGNNAWINKLAESYESGQVEQALNIVFCSTSETWFKPLLKYPQCFIDGRTNFVKPDGTVDGSATKGCVITYLGEDVELFAKHFRQFGEIKVKY